MLRVTIDINGGIIYQDAVYNTLEQTLDRKTIYRYLSDRRRIVKHTKKPWPLGGLYLAREILDKDIARFWKEYHDGTYDENKERQHWVLFKGE